MINPFRFHYGSLNIPDYFPDKTSSTNDISSDQKRLSFYRTKNSHQGISKYTELTHLCATQVNQDFLNEIVRLTNLKWLRLEGFTAEDLKPLKALINLETIFIISVSKAEDFSSLLKLPNLKNLYLENSKHMVDLEWLNEAHHLKSLGIEGSMYKNQKIPSLKPLQNLRSLEALFMSSVTLKDKKLTYLQNITKLQHFYSARFAPKKNFDELREVMPSLDCPWCDNYDI